jgi:hypothetical protein
MRRQYFRKDLSGKRFGRLVALRPVYKSKAEGHQSSYGVEWECQCDCGNIVVVGSVKLSRGTTLSCGCLRRLPPGQAVFNIVFGDYVRDAKDKGREFLLTKEEFYKLTQGDCFYCGSPPSRIRHDQNGRGDFTYNGVDRIDNTKGYIEGNCVSCCKDCNHMKGIMSLSEFAEHVKKIASNLTYEHTP